MDVCTLMISSFITLQGCISNYEVVCQIQNNVKYCLPDITKPINSCNKLPRQYWECKRPDGTIYTNEVKPW